MEELDEYDWYVRYNVAANENSEMLKINEMNEAIKKDKSGIVCARSETMNASTNMKKLRETNSWEEKTLVIYTRIHKLLLMINGKERILNLLMQKEIG
jgi:hypothetical protein